MKKLVFFLMVCLVCTQLHAQVLQYTITGKVIDAVTKAPLQAASVFAQNTTLGTVTDAQGNFRLTLPNGGYELAVTFTGYETGLRRITTLDADNTIAFELRQKEKELQDVIVRSSNEVKDGWEKYGDFFTENFIGKTANSKQCTIKNKEALHFFFYKRSNRLKVTADAPLEIANPALGYNIKYNIDSFSYNYNTQVSVYTGSPLFTEMQPENDAQKAAWAAKRVQAYKGSILHFMRSLYNKRLNEEGFEIQFVVKNNNMESAVPLKNYYAAVNYNKDDSSQTVDISPNQSEVAVLYKNAKPDADYLAINKEEPADFQLSVLSFLPKEGIVIEPNGYYYEQTDITIGGYWIWEKTGDMLPYDYMP